MEPLNGSAWVIGVVGSLQFDVLAARLISEYGVKGGFEEVTYSTARWLSFPDAVSQKNFTDKNLHNLAEDATGAIAYLAPNDWHLERIQQDFKDVKFARTRENR